MTGCVSSIAPPAQTGGVRSLHVVSTAADGSIYGPDRSWVLPGPARLIVSAQDTQVAARIGNRRYATLPLIALAGPSVRLTELSWTGAAPLQVEVDAMAWARWVRTPAAAAADRITPAGELLAPDIFAALENARRAVDDAGLLALAAQRSIALWPSADVAHEVLIAGFAALVAGGDTYDATQAAERLGTSSHILRRMALRWFGFAPKALLMRRRFLAALDRYRASGQDVDEALGNDYFDASHFLRDANRFLGMTPRRYLALQHAA